MGAGRFFSDPGKGLVKLEFGSLCSLTDSVRCGSSMERGVIKRVQYIRLMGQTW